MLWKSKRQFGRHGVVWVPYVVMVEVVGLLLQENFSRSSDPTRASPTPPRVRCVFFVARRSLVEKFVLLQVVEHFFSSVENFGIFEACAGERTFSHPRVREIPDRFSLPLCGLTLMSLIEAHWIVPEKSLRRMAL